MCAAWIGALLVVSLAAAILTTGGVSNGAGASSPACKGEIRGEIIPVDQTRTLWVRAYHPDDCDLTEEDAAEGFEDYDNVIQVNCGSGTGRASQQSSIKSESLSAVGYAYANGNEGGGLYYFGWSESVFEVVFDSSHNQ
jgi:hypothetical protein